MKRSLSLILSVLMILSLTTLTGCSGKEALKFGMGVHAYISKATSADADTNGEGTASVTVAAVLLDKGGKIVKCSFDSIDNKVAFTSAGKFVEGTEFKTKYELKDDYGMKAYGGAAKEWYEQADAFASTVVGKTSDEVSALVADGGKGNADVINAGCTIIISDFVKAIEKAIKNVKDVEASSDDTLNVAIVSTQTGSKDATDEADGVNEVDTTLVATLLDKNSKVVAIATDAIQAKFTFNKKGETNAAANTEITTKLTAGTNYGMAQYGQDLNGDGTVKEWNEQADAFNNACIGKNADEISKLAVDTGYAVEDLQSAGCTINISDMVKTANKAASK